MHSETWSNLFVRMQSDSGCCSIRLLVTVGSFQHHVGHPPSPCWSSASPVQSFFSPKVVGSPSHMSNSMREHRIISPMACAHLPVIPTFLFRSGWVFSVKAVLWCQHACGQVLKVWMDQLHCSINIQIVALLLL